MLCGFQDSAPSDLSLHAIPWLLRGNSIAGCRSRIEVYERLPSGALCCARSAVLGRVLGVLARSRFSRTPY